MVTAALWAVARFTVIVVLLGVAAFVAFFILIYVLEVLAGQHPAPLWR